MKEFLKELLFEIKRITSHPFTYPLPSKLIDQTKQIEKIFNITPHTLSHDDLEQLASKVEFLWRTKKHKFIEKLSVREKRNLPWLFYDYLKIIDRFDMLKSVLNFYQGKSSYVVRLIYVYLLNYDTSNGNEILRQFIIDNLKENTSYYCIRWKKKINFLFTKSAILNTAKWILSQKNKDPNVCLEELGLSGLLSDSAFVKEIIMLCLRITQKDISFLPKLLELLKSPNDPSKCRFGDGILPEVATYLLPELEQQELFKAKEMLCVFLKKYLGDPRLPGGATRWRKVSKEAIKVFMKWLVKQDIEFFFDIVDRTSEDPKWHYRRKFWEGYLPHIEQTWVVLGPKARDLAKNSEYSYGYLKGGNSGQSVFFIKMGGYVFVEFSNSGACRVFKETDFPFKFGERLYRTSDIYSSVPIHKQNHIFPEKYSWQNKFSRWIWMNLNIYSNNYYLF